MTKEKMVHYNPNTGKVEKCGAEQGKCPFGSENHFPESKLKEAQAYADRKNELKAKAEDVIKKSTSQEMINSADKSVKFIEECMREQNKMYNLNNAHKSLEAVENSLHMADDLFFLNDFKSPEVEEEGKREFNNEIAKRERELSKLKREVSSAFVANLYKDVEDTDKLIKDIEHLNDEQYYFKSREIKEHAGRMLRDQKMAEEAYERVKDHSENSKYFKDIVEKNKRNYDVLANTIGDFDNEKENLDTHVQSALMKQEIREDVMRDMSDFKPTYLDDEYKKYSDEANRILNEKYKHIPEEAREEIKNQIVEDFMTEDIMSYVKQFNDEELEKEVDQTYKHAVYERMNLDEAVNQALDFDSRNSYRPQRERVVGISAIMKRYKLHKRIYGHGSEDWEVF